MTSFALPSFKSVKNKNKNLAVGIIAKVGYEGHDATLALVYETLSY